MDDLLFDKKDVFSWSNCEEAKKYIGKEGYFGDSLRELQKNIEDDKSRTLSNVMENNVIDFVFRPLDTFSDVLCFGLFLPASKVIKLEKKYRPFKSHRELCDNILKDTLTCIDHGIEIEDKLNCCQYRLMIMGTFNNGIILPLYGALTFEQLFKNFKVNTNGEWRSFGVEEDE